MIDTALTFAGWKTDIEKYNIIIGVDHRLRAGCLPPSIVTKSLRAVSDALYEYQRCAGPVQSGLGPILILKT
jgi:hypothetical protein